MNCDFSIGFWIFLIAFMLLNLIDVVVYQELPKSLDELDPSTKKWVFSKNVAAAKLILCAFLIVLMIITLKND